jgi:hypothetical protein
MAAALSTRLYHSRVVGLSRAGKIALGAIAASGVGVAAYKRRKQIKTALQRAPGRLRRGLRDARTFAAGAREPGIGPFRQEVRSRRNALNAQGKGAAHPVVIPAHVAAKAVGYGLAGLAAGEITGPLGVGILGRITLNETRAAIVAGQTLGRATAYGAAKLAYARARRAERKAAGRAKSGTGAAAAG